MATAAIAGAAAVGILIYGVDKLASPTKQLSSLSTSQPQTVPVSERTGEWMGDRDVGPLLSDYVVDRDPGPEYPAPGGTVNLLTRRKGGPVDTPGLINRSDYLYTEPRISDAAWYDQEDWQLDCGKDSCEHNPRAVSVPPMDGQTRDEPLYELGDFIPGTMTDSRRYAEVELNEPPAPTRTYADYGLGWGEQLTSDEIPHGNSAQSDKQFWGPRNWEAERGHKLPTYLFGGAQELNGKEINRPMDDYTMSFDQLGDEQAVEYGTGAAASRTPDVRLMSHNLHGGIVTTRDTTEKKFLPPTANRGGTGRPPIEADIYLGSRLAKTFAGLLSGRGTGMGRGAPSDAPEVQLPAASRVSGIYMPRNGNRSAKTQIYGGEDVNEGLYGRINQTIGFEMPLRLGNAPPGGAAYGGANANPQLEPPKRRIGKRYSLADANDDEDVEGVWDTKGLAGPVAGGVPAGLEQNDAAGGYFKNSQLRIKNDGETAYGQRLAGGSGPLLLRNMASGNRCPKTSGDRQEYMPIGGGLSKWIGSAEPVTFKNRPIFAPLAIGRGSVNGSLQGPRRLFTVHGNNAIGTRGASWSGEPQGLDEVGTEAAQSTLYANIIGKRTEEALDDLFSVEHS